MVTKYKVHQFLAVPLLGNDGHVLGMFGVLDRIDGTGISQEDIRRARALSNQAAVVLEVARNLHLSEQHRRRAEALIELAREMDGALRLPEFARRFVTRTAELTGARAGLLAVLQEGQLAGGRAARPKGCFAGAGAGGCSHCVQLCRRANSPAGAQPESSSQSATRPTESKSESKLESELSIPVEPDFGFGALATLWLGIRRP